ncbi:MAG: transposase, partial [Bacteroidota bacterium]
MEGIDFDGFKEVFPDREHCLRFLAELKWQQHYQCKKCGYNQSSPGKIPYARRCRNCNYDESPTTDTLFHKLKFPLEKAFYLVYLLHRKDVNLSLTELSELIDLRRETCWAFKQKVLLAIDKSKHNKELGGWDKLVMVNVH